MGKTLRDEDLRLNIIINGDNGRKEMAALERSIHDTNAKLEALYAKRKKLEAQGKADTASYRSVQAQIGKYNKELDNNRAKLAALQRQQSINSMTLSELRTHINRVQTQLNKTDPKTPLWAKLNSELKASKQRLAEMSAQSKVTGGVVCNMAERINRYIGLITAGFASMTFAISGINRARRIFNEYDESLNNMRKTTGLTASEAEELSRKLAGIDTRTAQNELMGIARVAGKLGIAKEDLFGFVKAADVLKISLGKDLGDNVEATLGQIGKLVTVFHLTDEFGIEEAMMKAGAAINELGKSSTANEANIVNFTKRVAGIAATSKISIADVTGLGATVDACAIQIETAGTAINNVITGMFKRTRQFAAVARMSFTDFKDLLNKDVNEALNRVLEGMSSTDGMEKVVAALSSLKIEGARSVMVLSSLAKNTQVLRKQQVISNQAFEEGTSCLGEFYIMNETATAKMEKAKKAVTDQAVVLGRQLTPAITLSLSASTWFIRIMGSLVTIITKYHALLIGLAVAYNAHAIAQKTLVAWDKLAGVWKQRNILFSNQHRVALTREAIAIHATRNAETAASKATMLWCAAKNLLVGNIRAATLAMKTFFMSMGPIGWFTLGLSALATVAGGLVTHYKNAHRAQRLLSDNMKKATTDAAKERAELDRLKGKLEGCRKGTKEYNDTKAEIISKFRKYDSTLKSESLTVDTLASKYDNLTAAINRTYNARQYEKFSSDQSHLLDKTMTQNLDKIYSRLIKNLGDEKGTKVYTKILNSILGGEKLEQDIIEILDKIQAKGTITADSRIDSWIRNIREAQKAAADLDALARARFGITPSTPAKSAGSTSTTPPSSDNPEGGLGDADFSDDGKWSLDKDAAYQQRRHTLKKQYLAGEIETEREYNRQLLALDISTLQQRLKLNIDDAEERAKIQNTLDDKLLQQRDQNSKWSLGSDEAYMAAQLDLKKKYLNKEIQSETEYDDLSLQLEITALQNRLEKNIETGEDRISLEQQLADKLLSQQKRNAQRQAEADEILAAAETDLIAQENRRYELQKRKFAGQSNVLAALQKQHERKITKIQLDSANDRIAREDAQYRLSRKMLQNQHRQESALFSGNSQQRKALRKRQFEELAALDAEHLKNLTTQLQSLIDTGQIDDIKLNVSLLSNEEIIKLKNQLQDAVALLQNVQGGEDGSENKPKIGGIDNGADFLGLNKSQWTDLFSGNLEGWEDWASSIADVVSGIGSQTMQLWGSIDKLQTAQENKQLKEFEKNNNKKKKALEKRLNFGLITEAQYNAEVEAMDAEYEAYQEELAIKQAKRQKAMQIADATINTAVAVTKTFAEWGWPWGIVPAAIQSALGLAQIALIASTPISTGAEEGGFQDVTRRQDGRKYQARLNPNKRGFIADPTLLVAENGAEYVIPAEGLQNPTLLPFINTMETARRNGTLRNLNFESIYPAHVSTGLATGGIFNQQPHADLEFVPDDPRNGYLDPTFLRMLYSAVTKLSTILSKPIKADVSLMGRGNLLEKMDEYDRMKRRGKIGG